MNQPPSELSELPYWQLRLLEQLQNTLAQHRRLLLDGPGPYQPDHGSGEIQLQLWQTDLHWLAGQRIDILARARATVGLPESAVTHAIQQGSRQLRWDAGRYQTGNHAGEDLHRAQMVESLAGDVWRLEHMAAIRVQHRAHRNARRSPSPGNAETQFDRNLNAIWQRAATTAGLLDLTGAECGQLWGRDSAGWQRLFDATVDRYSASGLYERWHAAAWSGVEYDARRSIDNLGAAGFALGEPGPRPPRPEVLLGRAGATPTARSPGQGADEPIQAAVFSEASTLWDNEVAADATADPHWDNRSGAEPITRTTSEQPYGPEW
ncbi:hypothetical protein [Nocardia brasiliensis]|uniref:Uncharacterized protein n=1 Tax=Nocardia brasiliensis (strain ATCC 700358 / HUJEG-1) TaxID=1133849 RepID=K0F169_NOCB7|nr:hypothetical protein [Nocardia brasiliensis]AFU02850.1 hypothetical protein O3I_024485 [Nocardia brasiliensis ATCC 700358]OCF84822.1 hypothetical protein AW168_39455 [Nocardia brasiliensis]